MDNRRKRYDRFLKTLGKLPSDSLFTEFVSEVKNPDGDLIPNADEKPDIRRKWKPEFSKSEEKHIHSKKIWIDVVSEVDQENQKLKQMSKKNVIARLKSMGFKPPEKTLNACIALLQDHSRVVVAFTAKADIIDFHYRNEHEVSHDKGSKERRLDVEKNIFNCLKRNKNNLLNSPASLPRYGALSITENDRTIPYAASYGRSFVVLRPTILQSSLFLPHDSLYLFNPAWKSTDDTLTHNNYTPCTFFNLELLLDQCPDQKLKAIATRATTGQFPAGFDQLWPYTEVLVPGFNILDPNFVELLNLDIRDQWYPNETIEALREMGLTVTHEFGPPYGKLKDEYFRTKNLSTLDKLLKTYPILLSAVDQFGDQLLHRAIKAGEVKTIQFLLEHGTDLHAIGSNGKPAFEMMSNELRSKVKLPEQYEKSNAIWWRKRKNNLVDQAAKLLVIFQREINKLHPLLRENVTAIKTVIEYFKTMTKISDLKATIPEVAMPASAIIYWLLFLKDQAQNSNTTWVTKLFEDIYQQSLETLGSNTSQSIMIACIVTEDSIYADYISSEAEKPLLPEQKATGIEENRRALYLSVFHKAIEKYQSKNNIRIEAIQHIQEFLTSSNSEILIIGKMLKEARDAQTHHQNQFFKKKSQSDFATIIYDVLDKVTKQKITSEQRTKFIDEYEAFYSATTKIKLQPPF